MNVGWRLQTHCLRRQNCLTVYRYCSVETPKIKPPGKVGSYVVKKYISYIEKFELKFEVKYPKIYRVYKLFKDGIKDFFVDTKMYYSVATDIWGGKKLTTFSRKELETYRQMPSDMLRSAPVIIAAPLPFVPYFLYPVAYMFPRQLLCRHFWTEKQRVEFAQSDLIKHRMPHYRKILDYMEKRSAEIMDPGQKRLLTDVLYKIEQNKEPEIEEILEMKGLFIEKPFGIDHLIKRHKFHAWHLARGLDLSVGRKFLQDATIFHHIDLAMHREEIEAMNYETLQQCCFVRGLNAADSGKDDLKAYLTKWTHISSQIDISSISLMLHGPVLLGYTQKPNQKHLAKYQTFTTS